MEKLFSQTPMLRRGKEVTLQDIEAILKHNEDQVVIVDEAYIDFRLLYLVH